MSTAARAIEKIASCMDSMRDAHRERTFEGIGLSMPGRIDPESQRLVFAPNLAKWCEYDIKRELEARMLLPVELANAANASLLSELWSGSLDGV